MRIYVIEYFSSGLYELDHPESVEAAELLQDGWCMLKAIVDDLASTGNEVVTALSGRLTPDWSDLIDVCDWDAGRSQQEQLLESFQSVDAAIVIAPENDSILLRLASLAEESGVRLLSPSSAFVELASDKLRLGELWRESGVPTPETIDAQDATAHISRLMDQGWSEYLIKPRFGAGSEGIVVKPNEFELSKGGMVLQPIVEGVHASISFIGGASGYVFLPVCQQSVDLETSFRYQGGSGPMSESEQTRAERLATMALEVMPALTGFASFDIVLGEAPDEDYVIECNPRFTCSYEGLRRLVPGLAQSMLDLAQGDADDVGTNVSRMNVGEVRWDMEAKQL